MFISPSRPNLKAGFPPLRENLLKMKTKFLAFLVFFFQVMSILKYCAFPLAWLISILKNEISFLRIISIFKCFYLSTYKWEQKVDCVTNWSVHFVWMTYCSTLKTTKAFISKIFFEILLLKHYEKYIIPFRTYSAIYSTLQSCP